MADYSKLKVTELKELVKQRGIAAGSLKLKQNFVDALVAADAEDGQPDGNPRTDVGDQGTAGDTDLPDAADEAAPDQDVDAGQSLQKDADSSDNESRKRKRHQPTPPLYTDGGSKKLKLGDTETVELGNGEQQYPTGKPPAHVGDDVNDASKDATLQRRSDVVQDDAFPSHDSRHPQTRALYIRDLVRPLQPKTLQDHLAAVASSSGFGDDPIELFHLDKLRTHSLVLFTTLDAASRARTALHNNVWPDETMRKPLWVDFIPEQNVEEWIETENSQSDAKRWEVVYTDEQTASGSRVAAELQEVGQRTAASVSNGGPAPVNALDGAQDMPPADDAMDQDPDDEAEPNTTFDSLDTRFNSTKTKPKLYYQPVSRERVERRLEEFAQLGSRTWDEQDANPAKYAEGELRRFTFEDDRIVDGGADFGLFGRRMGRGGGGRGGGGQSRGGGGGGGGGYRGRQFHDAYRSGGMSRR